MYGATQDRPSSASAPDATVTELFGRSRVPGALVEREAKARRFVLELLRELRRLGYEDRQLRGRTVAELIDMRERAIQALMGAPISDRAAA